MSLKHAAFRAVSRAARSLSAGAPPPGLRVLTYHAVGAALAEDPYGTSMGLARFKEHVARLTELKTAFAPAPFATAPDAAPRLAVTFDDGYRDTLTTAAPLLAAAGLPFTVFVPPAHLESPGRLYLSKAELKELAALPGASIGAHGDRHVPLTTLDDAALASELSSAREKLEDALGRAATSLSYPFGKVDRRVRDAAARAGFTLGGTSVYGPNAPGRDPLLLRRTEAVAWDTADDLVLKVFGHWDWFRRRQGDPGA